MRGERKILLGTALVLAFIAAASLLAQTTGGVTGTAKDDKGNRLVGYKVVIQRQDISSTYTTKTDKKGQYIYIGLAPGIYKITLEDPSGHTIFYIQRNIDLGEPTVVDFDMAKEEVRQKQEMASNPEMAKQLQQQEQEQKKMTNLKAVFDQATTLYGQQKYAEAAALYAQALPLASGKNIPVVLARLADSYDRANQYDKALETYQKALQLTPDDATLYNNLGNVYAEKGKTQEAEQQYQKAAQLDPTHAAQYYFNMGAVFVNHNQPDAALDAFKKATQADRNYAEAYFQEGQVLLGKATISPDGKAIAPPGTIEAYKTYLKLAPNGPNAETAKQLVQTLQGEVQTQFRAKKKRH